MNDTQPRRATLAVKKTSDNLLGLRDRPHFLRLTASNGEPLLYGETHPNFWAGARAREAAIEAMIEVLEDEGYTVTPPTDELIDPMDTFTDPGAPE